MNIKELIEKANEVETQVRETLIRLTEKSPLILFDKDKIDTEEGISNDEVYDFPYGYFVGKHEDHLSGVVQKVEGNEVSLFLTGEEFGSIYEITLDQLPFGSQIELLTYLEERK
jgi:hypothetical protein